MRHEGQAQAGDLIRTPWGEVREIVSVNGAGDVIEAEVERSIRDWKTTPNFMRDSAAAMCMLFSSGTAGREKRDRERWLAKRAKWREAKRDGD